MDDGLNAGLQWSESGYLFYSVVLLTADSSWRHLNVSGHSAAFWLGAWTFMAQIFVSGSEIGSTMNVSNGEILFGA